jgi:hypothetical protein
VDNECAHWAPRRSEADQRRILARTYYAFEIACLSGWLEIPPTPGLEIRGFGHGECRREACEEVTVVLAIGHALRSHEALSRPYALPGFLEVIHRLFEDGVFVGHDRSIRAGILRRVGEPDYPSRSPNPRLCESIV